MIMNPTSSTSKTPSNSTQHVKTEAKTRSSLNVLDQTVSTEDIGLILILCGALFIILVTAFITCINRKRRAQVCCLNPGHQNIFTSFKC